MAELEPLISVIIPVYKVEAYLHRCVESVQKQTYSRLEIILVDDGSPDNCGKLCDELAAGDERIVVIHKPNGGLSSARNAGIDAAHGEYLGFVDSDDWIEPNMYAALYEALKKHDTLMAYGGRFDYSSRTGQESVGLCPPADERVTGIELIHRIFLWKNVDSAAWDKLYHRSLFRQIRYPLGVIGEDVPTTYRIALEAGSAAACPLPLYHYFHRPNSITTSSISEKDFRYVQNVLAVYEDILQCAPALSEEARYLKTVAVGQTLQMLEISDAGTRKKFSEEYSWLKNMLAKELGNVWKNALYTAVQKRDYTMMVLGIYRIPRMLYHAVKR